MTSRKHTRSRPEIAEACRSFFVGHDLILCRMIPEGIETALELARSANDAKIVSQTEQSLRGLAAAKS